MYTYDKAFAEYNHTVAQILLTAADVDHPDRFQNFHNTMRRLLDLKALPIINENDTVATEEMGIGDNDTLAAVVAVSMEADLLILLSDIDGLYTADPHTHPEATLIAEIPALTREIWEPVSYTHLDVYKRQAFCCSLLLLLRGFTHSNDSAFLYDLPKEDMVLHLEESISSSVSTSMDHTVSSHQWGLSGITAVGTLHLDQRCV